MLDVFPFHEIGEASANLIFPFLFVLKYHVLSIVFPSSEKVTLNIAPSKNVFVISPFENLTRATLPGSLTGSSVTLTVAVLFASTVTE